MERELDHDHLSKELKKSNQGRVKTIEWEDFEQELARLSSLSCALKEAEEKKRKLQQKLESIIQVRSKSLCRSNELEEMREKLEARKLVVGNMSMICKVAEEDAKKKEENLSTELGSLLVAGAAFSVAKRQLQESNGLLAGENGYARLYHVQRMLRKRQQHMVSQVSFLYPVKTFVGPAEEQELESFPGSSRSGSSTGSKPPVQGSMTISGLNLSMVPFTRMSLFTDKKEVQKSSSALGYVAHAVSLIASYLRVPLRYPLRLGNSHSYIRDYAPCSDFSSSDASLNTVRSRRLKLVEFPLFLDAQDTTRAAYAVFLLNKDLDELLSYIGAKSLGPRHVLGNLKELIRNIQSPEYLDSTSHGF